MDLIPIPQDGRPDLERSSISDEVMTWVSGNQAFYRVVGFKPPWIAYLVSNDDGIVGTCAFKGAPREGMVEIAYATRPAHEGKGIATRMAQELIRIAQCTDPSVRIIAQTLQEQNASTRVLAKCGFAQVREAQDDNVGMVWEWELRQ